MTYRPVELLVLVVLEECCPNEHICDLYMLGNTLCVGLAGAYSTQHTTLVGDRMRSLCRGILLPDSVECIFKVWCSLLDVLDNARVIVVEHMSGTEFLDQIKVSRAASGDDVEAIERSNLDGVLSDTRYTQIRSHPYFWSRCTHNYHPKSKYSSLLPS